MYHIKRKVKESCSACLEEPGSLSGESCGHIGQTKWTHSRGWHSVQETQLTYKQLAGQEDMQYAYVL